MREILFRGKRVNNGEWVEGGIIPLDTDSGYVFIAEPYLLASSLPVYEIIKHHTHLVDPETVGQYTGLTDKNGKKIFEGDIISERPPMNQIAYIGYVSYDEELAVWRFMIKNDTKFNVVLLGTYSRSYTVIGNIYDNPELMRATGSDEGNAASNTLQSAT